MQPYSNSGAVDTSTEFSTDNVRGKTAIVTGGANGIGEAYVRRLVGAGAFVVIGDLDVQNGQRLETELTASCKFIKCDMTQWEDQLAMFKTALSAANSGRIDIVIANAGISGYDSVFFNDIELEAPEKPRLHIADLNLMGVLYTVKLALFYFRKQNAARQEVQIDHVLLLTGSIAGYVDFNGGPQYTAAKHGLRGLMTSLRRTEWEHNIRVNYVAPWFVRTKLMSDQAAAHLQKSGVEFAEIADVSSAAIRAIADTTVNGRAFAVIPRSINPVGYVDIDRDDYEEGHWLAKMQELAGSANHRAKLDAASQKTSTLWAVAQ